MKRVRGRANETQPVIIKTHIKYICCFSYDANDVATEYSGECGVYW